MVQTKYYSDDLFSHIILFIELIKLLIYYKIFFQVNTIPNRVSRKYILIIINNNSKNSPHSNNKIK